VRQRWETLWALALIYFALAVALAYVRRTRFESHAQPV
jgi:hypothetical protein